VVTIAAAGALALAGCGDGDDSSSTTTESSTPVGATGAGGGEPLSKDEFLSQANAVCETGTKAIDQAADQVFTGRNPTDAQLQRFADLAVPAVQAQIDGIKALTPPEGDQDEVEAILDAAQKANDEVDANPSLLAAGNEGEDPYAEANERAADYGLTECGS
jgi:hypothetical protein